MKTDMYVRRPFQVEAVQVNADNMAELAEWCGGQVQGTPRENDVDAPPYFIKVDANQPTTDRQTMAFVNDWLLYAHNGYKVYTEKAFNKNFELDATASVSPSEIYAETRRQLEEAQNNLERFRDALATLSEKKADEKVDEGQPELPYDPATDNSAVTMTQVAPVQKHLCSICHTEFTGDADQPCPNADTHPDQPARSSS